MQMQSFSEMASRREPLLLPTQENVNKKEEKKATDGSSDLSVGVFLYCDALKRRSDGNVRYI